MFKYVAGRYCALQEQVLRCLGVKIQVLHFRTRRNSLLAKYFANSEILQMKLAIGEMGLTSSFCQLACGLVRGSVESCDTFIAMFSNYKTPKHH